MNDSNLGQLTAEFWRSKSDEELIAAASMQYEDEDEDAIIRAELRRRSLPEPEPTIRSAPDRRQGNHGSLLAFGIIVAVIGVATIVISPNLIFVEPAHGGVMNMTAERITDYRDQTKVIGVAMLVLGGIIAAVGLSRFTSTRSSAAFTPATESIAIPSGSPGSVELGSTTDEVLSVMGQPNTIINLDSMVIHVYGDIKIIYNDGKVSDVRVS